MGKIFETVSNNFYNILASPSKYMYDEILSILYQKALLNNTFTFSKEEFVNIIEEYVKNNTYISDFEDDGITTPRDKATRIYRNLLGSGWIDEEIGTNQEILTNFEDYSIAFLDLWFNYNKNNSLELSSKVYGIYQTLMSFNIDQGYLTLHTILDQANDLITKLRSLNSNIKKYIKKVIKLDNKNQVEMLNTILTQLLSEYKVEIIDKAYYYMKTNDNPKKYRHKFEERLTKIQENKNEMDLLLKQIQETEKLEYLDAKNKLDYIMNYLDNLFEEIIKLMVEIDNKNAKYINVTIEKIKIIMNNDKNIEGYLLNILKNFDLLDDKDLNFKFNISKTLNTNSLFVPKNIKKITSSKLLEEVIPIDEEKIRQQFENEQKYSRRNILNYIKGRLKDKKELTIEDFNLNQKEEFIKLILLFIYASSNEDTYKIEWFDDEVSYKNFKVTKFIIRGGE